MIKYLSRNVINVTFRLLIFLSLIIITPFGFASKFYRGPGAWWFNDYFGGVLYETFWILIIVFIWPHKSLVWTVFWVFVVTSFIEVMQLWHPHFLEIIRANFMGRTFIGTSFSWLDFPHYFLGCLMGYLWVRFLEQKSTRIG